VAHGIRRKGEEHCYIVGMHEQEEQGLSLLAGSRWDRNLRDGKSVNFSLLAERADISRRER
jgi:hypothetical protein